MSIKYASTSNYPSKDIPPTPVISPPNYVKDTWTRPSDWLALPSITNTEQKFVGLHAVTNDDSNFVALSVTLDRNVTNGVGYISSGAGSASGPGTIFTPRSFSQAEFYAVGMFLTGTNITGTVRITEQKRALFTGSISGGNTLTVTSWDSGSDPIQIGMMVVTGNNSASISGFGTGSGGVGTYTLQGAAVDGAATAAVCYIVDTSLNTGLISNITGTNAYTVDWGDGSVISYPSGTQANYQYNYSTLSSSVSSRGYKMAIVTVTKGANILFGSEVNMTIFNLQLRYNATTPGTISTYRGKWLDIAISGPFLTSFLSTSQTAGPTAITTMAMLEQISFLSCSPSYINMSTLFANGIGLRSVPVMPDMSNVTNLGDMFNNCPSLTTVPYLGNTIKVTNTGSMFRSCSGLLDGGNLSIQNFSNVTNMFDMFNGCISLKEAPLFDTSNVTAFGRVFANCASLTTVPLYNTAKVTDMRLLFQSSPLIDSVPAFNTSNAQNMSGIFAGCIGLKTAPQFDYSKTTDPSSLFTNCVKLRSIPPMNLPVASTIASMFSGCSSLDTIPLLNIPNVTAGGSAFSGCVSLKILPTISMPKVTDASSMFNTCRSLVSIPITDTGNLTNTVSMFNTCVNLQEAPNLVTDKVTNMNTMFNSCFSLISVPLYNTINVTTMSSMFGTCTSLSQVPTFNTSNVTDMSSMFSGCTDLMEIPPLNTPKVTTFASTFQNVNKITKFDGYNTSNATNFSSMFNGANNLTSVGNINMVSDIATATTNMFNGCTTLSKADISNIRVSLSVTSCLLSNAQITNILNNLIPPASAQTLTITNNWGVASAVAKTGNIQSNSSTIAIANTVGITSGMFVYGTGINAGIPVTFTDTGDLVNYTNASTTNVLSDGDEVLFTTITTTTGISANTRYYVVNSGTSSAGKFQVSSTLGGSAIALTTNGSGVMTIGGTRANLNVVTTVNANSNVVINGTSGLANTTASLSFRVTNINTAGPRNWIVAG